MSEPPDHGDLNRLEPGQPLAVDEDRCGDGTHDWTDTQSVAWLICKRCGAVRFKPTDPEPPR